MPWPAELNFSRRRHLPAVLGAESAECGLACLTMIAAWHGHDVDLNGMRQRFALSLRGVSLKALMEWADSLGLTSRALKVELESLRFVQAPAILHWNMDHFVVLKSCSRRFVVVHDPAQGVRRLSWSEVSNHFTGVAVEFAPSAAFERIRASAPVRLRSLWSRLEGFWGCALQVLGLSFVLQALAFATPFYLQLAVDQGIESSDGSFLAVLAAGFGVLVLLQAFIEGCRGWTLQAVGQLANFQIMGNLVRHLLRVRADFFEKRHIGDITSRLSSAKALQEILTRGAAAAIIDGAMALGASVVLFIYSTPLALVVLASVALQLALTLCAYPMIRRRTEEQLSEAAAEQTLLMEIVRAAATIRLGGREAEREGRWRNAYARVVNATVSAGKWQILLQVAQTLILGVQTVLVVYLGARAVLAGEGFSLGMLMAFLALRQTFTDRAASLVSQVLQFRILRLHLDRLADIVQAEREVIESPIALRPQDVRGDIALQAVSFRYGLTDAPTLTDVSLNVAPGEFVAITGPSGGGKSTLIKVMLGLNRPTSGEVVLDGAAATPALFRAWREHVGVVAQDDRLLSGSLAANIAFFDPDMDMARVVEVARVARIHDEIVRMPMQYLSLVGDMGAALSGGQRQRVLLARALYRRPRVLFLDEGTANLDVDTEQEIAEMLSGLPITRVVVAHRPALLERADRVVIIGDGRIVQEPLVNLAAIPAQ